MPARLDFKAIAESIDIYEVAQYLGLAIVKNRATCPACESDRALQFYAETNSFYCNSAKKAGDCISLVAHVKNYSGQYLAAKELAEQFGTATAAREPATTPTSPEARTGKPQPAPPSKAPFDPAKFEDSLAYSAQVAALGLSEDEAKHLGIGEKRGKVYVPIRYPSGVIAGWQYGEFQFPKQLLPDVASNVVKLKRA